MNYELFYHPRSLKFLSKVDKKTSLDLVQKIDNLIIIPWKIKQEIKKLSTTKNSYRLRVGKIRVVFEISHQYKKVYILDIDYRGNIY